MTGLTKTTQITTVTYSYKPPPVTNHKQNKCTVDSSKRQRGHVHGPSEAPVRQTGRVPHNKHCHACCSSYSCQKHQNMTQYHTTNTSSCSCQKASLEHDSVPHNEHCHVCCAGDSCQKASL